MEKTLIQVRAEPVDLENLERIKARWPLAESNQTAILQAINVAANAVTFWPKPEEVAALESLGDSFPGLRGDYEALIHLALAEFVNRREMGEGKYQILQRIETKLDQVLGGEP